MTIEWPNFEELRRLAETSPEKLETIRKQHVDAIIDRAPEEYRRRLRGLQFQIDCQRKLHSTPLGSCVAISKLMHDSLQRLNAVLQGENDHGYRSRAAENNIVPFAG